MRDLVPILLWTIPLLMLAAGAVLASIGLRGRRTDMHPLCAQCGYDLIASSDSLNCPECGRALDGPRAIVLGHRVRRKKPLVAGAVLLFPALLVIIVLGIGTARGVNFNHHKPVWLLVREGDSAAVQELTRRVAAGVLSDAQVRALVERGLELQADRSRPWLHAWGTLIETAWIGSDEQWLRYVRQGTAFRLDVRPRVRAGDPIIIRVSYSEPRAGAGSLLQAHVRLVNVRLGGEPLLPLVQGDVSSTASQSILLGRDGHLPIRQFVPRPGAVGRLKFGEQAVSADLEIEMRNGWRRPTDYSVPLEARIALLPPSEASARSTSQPALRPAILAAVDVGLPGLQRAVIGDRMNISFDVAATSPPVGLAARVSLRDAAGVEWPVGTHTFPAGAETFRRFSHPVPAGFDATRVDVVLRSGAEAATRSLDVEDVWEGEIVLRNVPVIWAAGARPSKAGASR